MRKFTFLTKSLLIAVVLCVCAVSQAFGQISNGSPTARTIKTGNRPGAGDWGLYVGLSLDQIKALKDKEINWKGIPILNFKYFASDELELRLGFLGNSKSVKAKGSLYDELWEGSTSNFIKQKDGEYVFYPGVAYHFSPTNILDVYVGCDIPIGYSYDKYIYQYDGKNDGTQTRSSFELGFEGFVGLQCFIADLPLAIGVEYGFGAMRYFGQKYKNIVLDEDDNEQTYYTTDKDEDDPTTFYKDLKRQKGKFGSEIRFTVSYYFNM